MLYQEGKLKSLLVPSMKTRSKPLHGILLFASFAFCPFTPLQPEFAKQARQSTYILETKIPLNGGTFTTDNLQNIYIWNHCSIKKVDAKGRQLYDYDDRSYGDVSSLDVTDPMKLMAFYKNFPEVLFLDNTLSINGTPINPGQMGFPLTTLACLSHDNGVWLYDAQNLQLVRLDKNMNIKQQTGSLMELLGFPVNPNYLMEYNDYVYMNDTAQGILEFDEFGTYYRTIPVKGLTSFEVRGNELFYLHSRRLHTLHLNTLLEDETALPDSLSKMVRIEKNLLFENYLDTVRIYEIK